ncbi:hypothetical protein KM043_000331 [Ampulex compressa]|nr:hypothetical protein KM043_000331 [Ampulex compressa]
MTEIHEDISNVNLRQIQYQLLNQALSKAISQNTNQTKIWTDYRNGYKKVIEALTIFPTKVSVNCMIPIGKKALMKGKLIHTNEILACLGEGYFAKYSATQSIALCKRRIECAEKMLKDLEIEKNLYEMKQLIPVQNDVFAEGDRTDINEFWNDKNLQDWRAQHRQREKEYRQKLAELRQEPRKTEIETEEDLFQRLDELELEEELLDELNRLGREKSEFLGEDLEDGEVYYETDDSSSGETTVEIIEEELQKLKKIQTHRDNNNSGDNDSKLISRVTKEEETPFANNSLQFQNFATNTETNDSESAVSSEDETLRIEFKHAESSGHSIEESRGETIESPRDIYRLFMQPKSILKKTSHTTKNYIAPNPSATPNVIYSTDEESEDDSVKTSAYKTIVKDVQEKPMEPIAALPNAGNKKRIVSRFKMERSGLGK